MLSMKKNWDGVWYLIVAIACFVLAFPIAGASSGIAVYLCPPEVDEVGVGWSTMFIAFGVSTVLGLVFLILGIIKGGTITRLLNLLSLLFIAFCIFVITIMHTIM